jgi:hypothetical protein
MPPRPSPTPPPTGQPPSPPGGGTNNQPGGSGNGPNSSLPGGFAPPGRRGGSSAPGSVTLSDQSLSPGPLPSVEPLTPIAGISFGKAPYLWPLFILLDVIAAAAAVLVVRKTWSKTPDGPPG